MLDELLSSISEVIIFAAMCNFIQCIVVCVMFLGHPVVRRSDCLIYFLTLGWP